MTQEKAWAIACVAYCAAEQAADEAYAVSLAEAKAQFDREMRDALLALDAARGSSK